MPRHGLINSPNAELAISVFTDPGSKSCASLSVYWIFRSGLPAGDSIGQVALIATGFLTADRGSLNRSVWAGICPGKESKVSRKNAGLGQSAALAPG
jgi:hypothetical protein